MFVLTKKFLQRAALIGVALFFAVKAFGSKPLKADNSQELIEKAYSMSLQKNRQGAVDLLVNAIKKENKKNGGSKDLIAALQEVSAVFYSDKAQQLYELALSLRTNDPNLASQKLGEAAKQEPDNQQIALEQMRLQVATNDCDGALKQGKKWIERNPFSEELRLVAAQAAICSGQLTEYQSLRAPIDLKKNGLEIYWNILDLEQMEKSGLFAKGRELAQQVLKSDSAFPETYYWLWKFERAMKVPEERSGTKYLTACKSMSSRSSRQYMAEPRLCRRISEVEAGVKKTGN